MVKVNQISTYLKKIDKKRVWKKALVFLVAGISTFTMSGCLEALNDELVYEPMQEQIASLEEQIKNFEEDKKKEIEEVCSSLNETIEKLETEKEELLKVNQTLEKKNQDLEKQVTYLSQEPDVINSIPKEDAYRIFYDENGFLDVDCITEAFQFSGAEDYQLNPNPSLLPAPIPINYQKMGEYFVEIQKDGIGYLVSATDYTMVKTKGRGFGRSEELSTLVYCPYYDPKNGGKDSPDGYPGYILSIRNKDSVKDTKLTIYDFDTFEVLASDCILYNDSLAWNWADRRNLYHIDPCQTEDGLKGEYNCTIIKKSGVNYLVDYSSFEVLAVDVKNVDCKFDEAGVRVVTITHSNGKKTVYLNDTLKPLETDILIRKRQK